MGESRAKERELEIWENGGRDQLLAQMTDLALQTLGADSAWTKGAERFEVKAPAGRPGLLAVTGDLSPDLLLVSAELMRGDARISALSFFEQAAELGDKARFRVLRPKGDEAVLAVELKVQASPLSMVRVGALLSELKRLDDLARGLQAEAPAVWTDADLIKTYKPFADQLDPVLPLSDDDATTHPELTQWAEETFQFLEAGLSLGLSASYPLELDFALALLARFASGRKRSIGRIKTSSVPPSKLIEIASHAPGIVTVPAISVNLGTYIYELASEVRTMLAALSSRVTPVVFTGTFAQHQTLFSGGQGGGVDPLLPVVCHVPSFPTSLLARLAVTKAAALVGGVPAKAAAQMAEEILLTARQSTEAGAVRLLPVLAAKAARVWAGGQPGKGLPALAVAVEAASETFGGLTEKPRSSRSKEVQERYVRTMADPNLVSRFKEHLLGQDEALAQLAARLQTECLTRPLNQPIRYCAQGTPGIGKSESAALLARFLGVPYVNIDAASIPDTYTAAAMLLGSGRGIVGSYQMGRLEQIAKHHTGAVVEIADLDHAPAAVRACLADLFLQVMETGEAQSANGAGFSCANLILAFTLNLPDGLDEAVRKGIGFEGGRSEKSVKARVVFEIKKMLSGAFLSRAGSPILFRPLSGDVLVTLIEQAVQAAARSALDRLGLETTTAFLQPGTGAILLEQLDSTLLASGVRGLLDYARGLAAEAILQARIQGLDHGEIVLTADPAGRLRIATAEPDAGSQTGGSAPQQDTSSPVPVGRPIHSDRRNHAS